MRLYHGTTLVNAGQVAKNGFQDVTSNFGLFSAASVRGPRLSNMAQSAVYSLGSLSDFTKLAQRGITQAGKIAKNPRAALTIKNIMLP